MLKTFLLAFEFSWTTLECCEGDVEWVWLHGMGGSCVLFKEELFLVLCL